MKRLASIFTLLLLSVILFSVSSCSSCEHEWIDATCTTPKTCKLCDETEGKRLKHQWIDATCMEPKTCKLCNKTIGEALGHSIVVDEAVVPTCTDEGFTEGEHCEVCELVLVAQEEISSLGHTWNDATCTEPKTCEECGKTRGKALGHDSEWNNQDIDFDDAIYIQELLCNRCEKIIETQKEPIESFVENGHFMIYPHAFAKRFEKSSNQLNNINYSTKSEYSQSMAFFDEDNTIFYRIQDVNYDYEDVGIMSFSMPNGKDVAVMDDFTENKIECINILIENSYDVSAVVYSAILAIDPGIGYSEAADVGQTIVDNVVVAIGDIEKEDFEYIEYNGIGYFLYRNNSYHYLFISATPF